MDPFSILMCVRLGKLLALLFQVLGIVVSGLVLFAVWWLGWCLLDGCSDVLMRWMVIARRLYVRSWWLPLLLRMGMIARRRNIMWYGRT